MPNPTLFFDIDGVMHPLGSVSMMADGSVHAVNAFCWLRPFEETLRDFPKVQLVMHSTWRLLWETDAELKAQLPGWLAGRLHAVTPRDIVGRYRSIEAFCAANAIQDYVILDDERDAFPPNLPELVVCGHEGMSHTDTQGQLWKALKHISKLI